MPNDKITAVGANIAEKAAMIWNVADMLRGPFKPHEYGLVILPMTVVKRFHDCLLPTHQAVLDTYEKVKKLQVIDGFLQKASGYQFYNTSRFTFETLLADPDNIESNFRDYLSGFSANAQDVLAKFDFDNIIKRMVESNTLYLVIKEFGSEKGYLGPDKISAVDCGYIFEDLVRRFSESFGEEAGAHFTSRDIIYLMTDLLLSEADLDTSSMTVYDMAMGTSQMLSCMEERIHELNSDIEVTCFGQEFNPSTFAIAKADMMIRGGDPNNMRFGDTLSEDQFPGFTFQYIISNPPFGIDWKREQKAVEAEAARGEMGRFAPGLPKISDGQQLFVLNGLAKLANKGKMAIIQNGSPLFSGDAGSGPSNIRQYILENDWLDCIIQLSTDMFMNTGISTYIWVLSKDKPAHRANKVQLIDASHCFEPRRKSIGTKRNDITDACRKLIVTAYGEFANGKVYGDKNGIYCESKVFERVDFGYNKIVVERPQRDEAGNVILKRGKPVPDTSLRDTENVPLVQDIDAYFAREVLPYAPDAWIDHSKTKVGYEIPMTRYFYEYQAPEAVEDIVARITALEQDISAGLAELFHKESRFMKGKKMQIRNSTADFLVFTKDSGSDSIEVRVQDHEVWLTQKSLGQLFDVDRSVITKHLKNVFQEGELDETTTCANFAQVADNGRTYHYKFYSLPAIIAVGYRINSTRATQFRQWATKVLDTFTRQGYVLDKDRLINGQIFDEDYFEHLISEIQEIRASERRFYQKITDIYATAVDYSVDSKTTKDFFATVQNKMHYAIHGNTAAEVIMARADHTKEHMGLTTWKNAPDGKIVKADVSIAKNYLSSDELHELNEIVTMYLDYATRQARRHIPMTMADWSSKLDAFLQFNDAEILHDKGKVTAAIAKAFAESEFEQYRVLQDELYQSDFDRLMAIAENKEG